jgi:hypothetical protein
VALFCFPLDRNLDQHTSSVATIPTLQRGTDFDNTDHDEGDLSDLTSNNSSRLTESQIMVGYYADPLLTREQRCARLWKSFTYYLELMAYTTEDVAEVFAQRKGAAQSYQRLVMRYKLLLRIDFVQLWGSSKGKETLQRALRELRRAPLARLAPSQRRIGGAAEEQTGKSPLWPPTELITATECPIDLFLEEIRRRQRPVEPVPTTPGDIPTAQQSSNSPPPASGQGM